MGDAKSPIARVLLTGFGPFGVHTTNASWEAVQEVQKLGLENVELTTLKIPVVYDYVKCEVPKLWEKYKPDLVIHVGVAGIATELTLEQRGHNIGYEKEDINGCIPHTQCCIDHSDECIPSGIDMGKVADVVNDANVDVTAVVSNDAGRYLCDYIYYTSLNRNRSCSAFIHVPPIGKPYSERQLAEAIKICIYAMLDQCKCS